MRNDAPKMTVFPFNHVPLAEVGPDNAAFKHFRTAEAAAEEGLFEQACAAIQEAIKLARVVTAVENPLRPYLAHLWATKGGYYMSAGQYSDAIRALDEAITLLELYTGSEFHEDAVYMHEMMATAHLQLAASIKTAKQ